MIGTEDLVEKYNEITNNDSDSEVDEFDEFVRKVNEINDIVKGLRSADEEVATIAQNKSDEWLAKNTTPSSCSKDLVEETIHRPGPPRPVNKTVINEKAFTEPLKRPPAEEVDPFTSMDSASMSQEAFMSVVEADAKKRTKERRKKIRESDAIKVVANKAFRSGEYEKALDLFNKAIDVRKDSLVLYTNRALTLLHLGLFSRALEDCEWALKVHDGSLKARLYMARAHHGMGDPDRAEELLEETRVMFPHMVQVVDEYRATWPKEEDDDDD